MSNFDQVAAQFELYRAFPPEALSQIQQAVSEVLPGNASLLEIGSGTGRFGRSFLRTGSPYFAVDHSSEMLRLFAAQAPDSNLVQADASALPFSNNVFAGVLLFHFFGAASGGVNLFSEIRRVLASDGIVIVGQRAGEPDAIDAQMRRELRNILAAMNVTMPGPGERRETALKQFESFARSHHRVVAASWKSNYTPGAFLKRHRTGAWFSQLDTNVQDESLALLSTWASKQFGSLEAAVSEEYRFHLDIFSL